MSEENARTQSKSIVRVGPAGWAYKDWSGIVYPKPRPKGFREASFLADYFNTIELNVTFYRPISAATATGWMARVAHNPEFLFTAKLWREFTHTRDLSAANEDAFRPAIDTLHDAGRLGALLAQFPWSFKNSAENLAYLDTLASASGISRWLWKCATVRGTRRTCMHGSRARSGVLPSIDQPIIGRSLGSDGKITGPIGYVRLHGRNYQEWFKEREDGQGSEQRYDYLYEEKKSWSVGGSDSKGIGKRLPQHL